MKQFLTRWFRLIRALIVVARTEAPAAPVSSEFDFENEALLHELMKNHHFERMVRAISKVEMEERVQVLRAYVRQQKWTEAAMTEASLEVFEDLPHAFRRLANAYRGEVERP